MRLILNRSDTGHFGKGYTEEQRRVLQRKLSYGEEDLFVFGGPTRCLAEEGHQLAKIKTKIH